MEVSVRLDEAHSTVGVDARDRHAVRVRGGVSPAVGLAARELDHEPDGGHGTNAATMAGMLRRSSGTSRTPGRHDEAGWCEQVVAAGMLLRSTETR